MKKFKRAYLEITNICNFNCSFCPKTQRALQSMDLDEIRHVLDDFDGNVDEVYLHLMGEPTFHPNFTDVLEIFKNKRQKFNITTNASLLNCFANELLTNKYLRKINISLHSLEKGELNTSEYLKELLEFLNAHYLKIGDKPTVVIRLWNISEQQDDGEIDLRNRYLLDMLSDLYNLEEKLPNKVTKLNGIKLANNSYISIAEKFKWPNLTDEAVNQQGFCYGLRTQFGILVDGTVVPCCLDNEGKIALGNIFKQSIAEILSSERATNIFDAFSNRQIVEPLCKTCGYIKNL